MSEKKHFVDIDPKTYVEVRQRIQLFFKLLFESTIITSTKKEAYDLIVAILAEVEEAACIHNTSVASSEGQILYDFEPMILDTLPFWYVLNGLKQNVFCNQRKNQDVLIGENGAIEIHQQIENTNVRWHNGTLSYQTDDHETFILARPGANKKDVWLRPLPHPVEKFSQRFDRVGPVPQKLQIL